MKNTIGTLPTPPPPPPKKKKKNVKRNKINTFYTQIHDHPGFEQALKLKVAG